LGWLILTWLAGAKRYRLHHFPRSWSLESILHRVHSAQLIWSWGGVSARGSALLLLAAINCTWLVI